ncbi:putative aspartyl protease [Pedobacter sp. UYP30]|uniref:aspartyl protease family protein n=1 Tax=Pedobacter sp. UYP30 TaxID=1756400 RepID=UPI0033913659
MLAKYKTIAIKIIQNVQFCLCSLLLVFATANAQQFRLPENRHRQSITFKSIKNLIVVPVLVNGKGPYDFILDTGVGPMIITDPSILDSLDFHALKKVTVSGLGTDTLVAYVSQSINAQIGRAKISRIPTAILNDDLFNLSGYLGKKIYGIIGFSFFNSFVVDIRYSQNRLIIYQHDAKIKLRGKRIPLQIYNQRPYVSAEVAVSDGVKVMAKFLVDTGASHSLSMETLGDGGFPIPQKKIAANLGMSLSGRIKGYVGRIASFNFGGHVFKNIVAGFPNYKTIIKKIADSKRNGTLGAELLKRFDVQFDYANSAVYLKLNSYAKKPFNYDKVGAVLYLDLEKVKRYMIAEVDEDSPADKGGLLAGDEILAINFSDVNKYSLDELAEMFKSNLQKTIIFEIARNGKVIFRFVRPEDRI